MFWQSLRKTMAFVDVEQEYATDTLFAENIRLRVDDDAQLLDVSVDLNKNLRTRSKGSNTYVDAKGLSDDRLSRFKSIGIRDSKVLADIENILNHLDFEVPAVWRLHVALEGDYWFLCRPEYAHHTLRFRVESVLDSRPVA